MKYLMLIISLLLIGGFSMGIQESVSHNFDRSIFKNVESQKLRQWLKVSPPENSYLNKWKDRNGNPETRKEAFPFSSTFLVIVTDAYHCFKFIFMICFFLTCLLLVRMFFTFSKRDSVVNQIANMMLDPYKSIIPLSCMYLIWNIGFYLSYSWIPKII